MNFKEVKKSGIEVPPTRMTKIPMLKSRFGGGYLGYKALKHTPLK